MRILAFDPGKNLQSFAFSFMVDGVVDCYGLVRPISTMKHPDFAADAADFHGRIKKLVRGFGMTADDAIVAERFMDRGGGGKGTTGEHINAMLGLMQAAILPLPLELVMPSTWKGWLARTYQTGKQTKTQQTITPNLWMHLRTRFPEQCWPTNKAARMIIHEGDACGIALWKHESLDPNHRGTITHMIDPKTVKIMV